MLGSIFEGQEFAWVGRALQINADWRTVAQVYGAERTPRHLFPFVSQHQVTAETLIERTWETTIAKETTGVSGGSVRFNHPLVLDSLSVHLRYCFFGDVPVACEIASRVSDEIRFQFHSLEQNVLLTSLAVLTR